MKTILPFFFVLFSTIAFSQACEPDTLYRDSTAGVYPRPLSDVNPNGGIDTFACIGQPFEFVFTVIIPDTFSFNGLLLTLLSAEIATSGAVTGLPAGMGYACNPPDCIFPADSIGCIVLQGIPDATNQPADYEPVIEMTINTNIFPITTTFPGAIFPGKYILELRDENCLPVSITSYQAPDSWLAFPNPVIDKWNYSYSTDIFCEHRLAITDLTGKTVISQNWKSIGAQEGSVDLSHLSAGIYLYTVKAGDKFVSGRIILGD